MTSDKNVNIETEKKIPYPCVQTLMFTGSCVLIFFFKSDPYVRILMFNGSGRLVKKKKTTVKVNIM